jgi:S1-C subfamily serine protease
VAAIGAPVGLETSITRGGVSAVGRHKASEK